MRSIKILFKYFFLFFFPLWAFHFSWAAEDDGSAIYVGTHRFRPSLRALGMGDAYSTIVDGKTAPFYNPALLAFLPKESQRTVNLLDVSAGYGAFVQYKDISEKLKIKNRENKIRELNNILSDELGNLFSLRTSSLAFYWYKKDYAIAIIPLDASLYFKAAQQLNVVLHLKGYADTSFLVSQSTSGDSEFGKWALGYTTKLIYRGYISHTLSVADLAFSDSIISNNEMSEGTTIDIDMGVYYSPRKFSKGFFHFFHPSFSMVLHNTFDYGFFGDLSLWNKESNDYKIEKLHRTFDVGSKLELQDMEYVYLSFTAEIKDIGHPYWRLNKNYHIGFLMSMKSFLRELYFAAGLNQGYTSTGIGFLKGHLALDVAIWKDEVGDSKMKQSLTQLAVDLSLKF